MSDINPIIKAGKPGPANFYVLPDQPPALYVNGWSVTVGSSEVLVKCGFVVETNEKEQAIRELATLVLTHDGFLKMIASLEPAITLLKEVYRGNPPSLDSLSPERVQEINEKIANKKK